MSNFNSDFSRDAFTMDQTMGFRSDEGRGMSNDGGGRDSFMIQGSPSVNDNLRGTHPKNNHSI